MRELHFSLICVVACLAAPLPAQEILPDGTDAAQRAISGFRVPAGMKVELFAAEPQLSGPVALCLDDHGRVFVAEEYRFNRGTEENRTRPFLLDVDLQIDSLEQRLAAFEKFKDEFEGGMDWFTKVSDQIRLLEDTNNDGRADRSTVFAKFNEPLDGLVAGVIARDGDVYVTCIPHLWLMRDEDGDGVADVRKSLHRGFGVNNAFLGHDLHGLVWGPDGRLYFSVGDRGYNLVNHERERLYGPRRGAVFRCDPDGSNLEVVHTGLRNPQELAFDEFGNLFAADNNCDKGDLSRLVYVVQGGDSGWNMAYQTIPDPYLTGPWHAEKLWHVNAPDQPAYIVPPVGALGAGPSGFVYYPGVGLPERYSGHFFLCNYTGNGGIESFAVKQKGAGFEIVDEHDFLKPLKATDVDFGYDGKMYVSDFVNLDWSGKSLGGRIYTVFPESRDTEAFRETQELFRNGFHGMSANELMAMLFAEPDMRIRLRAQFELAGIGGEDAWSAITAGLLHKDDSGEDRLGKLHCIWCAGQLLRVDNDSTYRDILAGLLNHPDAEIRAHVARVLGEVRHSRPAGHNAEFERLVSLLHDPSPRVRFMSAMTLARWKDPLAVPQIVRLLRRNNNQDAFIRHAGVVALTALASNADVDVLAQEKEEPALRLAAALVLRRRADPSIARFLNDPDVSIATEAARAINDLPLDEATAELASLTDRILQSPASMPDALVRRVINACFRIGDEVHARRLVSLITNPKLAPTMRAEALACLNDWGTPGNRDRVTGFWRPLPDRDTGVIKQIVNENAEKLLAGTEGTLLTSVLRFLPKYDVRNYDDKVSLWSLDEKRTDETRVAAFEYLVSRKSDDVDDLAQKFVVSDRLTLRAAGWRYLATSDPPAAVKATKTVILSKQSDGREKQAALKIISRIESPDVDVLIRDILWSITDQTGKRDNPLSPQDRQMLELDIVQAAQQRKPVEHVIELLARYRRQQAAAADSDPLARYRAAMFGGSATSGESLFRGHRRAQCLRCHKVNGNGGVAGPDLTLVADRAKGDREFLLESLVNPHAKIAKGFGTVTFVLDDGRVLTGVIESESDESVLVRSAEGREWSLKPDEIDVRTTPKSPMPPMGDVLKLAELRDLVEFLTTLHK